MKSAEPRAEDARWRGQQGDPSWAWAPYAPDAARPWDLSLAAHLYRRVAFGARWGELQQALADGPQRTVTNLLHPKADAEIEAFNRAYDGYERDAADAAGGAPAWWLRRLAETPHPFLEQMTLFWHNHFALTNARVNNAAMMCRHVQLLRRHALGRFDTLLEAVLDEPATFVCLGARANRKTRPSEDLPRALLEEFTLGPGQFSAADVRAAARAFTGWFVSQGELRYQPHEHDSGPKKLLGQEGDFEKKDVLRLALAHPAAAPFFVRKLYRWFVSEASSPPDALLAPLAAAFAKHLQAADLAETMLRSNLFFAAAREKIKSPVDFALGIIRPLEHPVPTVALAADLAALGQDLLAPPTTKGWAGGRCWINRLTLLGRAKLAQNLLASAGPYGGRLDPAATALKYGHASPEAATRFVVELLAQNDLPAETRQALLQRARRGSDAGAGDGTESARRLAMLIVTRPEFCLG